MESDKDFKGEAENLREGKKRINGDFIILIVCYIFVYFNFKKKKFFYG